MRFMVLYKPAAGETGAPPSLKNVQEMGQFVEQGFKSGRLLSTDGLQPSAKGARVRLSHGKTTVVDGPFSEAKELVGGYAVVRTNSKDEAIQMAKDFLNIAGDGETEIRQIYEESDFQQ